MRPAAVLILGVVLTCLAYSPLRSAVFVYDDAFQVESRAMTTADLTQSAWSVLRLEPRSLTNFSIRLNGYFFGIRPQAYHLTNLALHLICGLVLAWALSAVLSPLGACVAAALFLVHPLNSQAVSYISARSELVACLGVLLALGCGLREWKYWPGVLIGLWIGVTGKETALVAVPLLIWMRLRGSSSPVWPRIALAAGVVCLWRVPQFVDWASLEQIGRQVGVLMRFLAFTLWPVGLSVDHDVVLYPLVGLVAAWIALGLLMAYVWRERHARPALLTALGVLLIAIGPRLVLTFSEFGYLSEHHLYVPLIGVWYAAGSLFEAA